MARISALYTADGASFVSRPVDRLVLTLEGIAGDLHAGPTRKSDSRTPWHGRGTRIANTRQLSLVSAEECAAVARALEIESLDPALIGSNLVVEGIADFTRIAPGTRLQAPSGATIFITEPNAPCRQAGRSIAAALARPDIEFGFPKHAKGMRGVVALVEREGEVAVGDALKVIRAATG